MEVFDPPCVVKDVISHVFRFDNLQNYLLYLEDKSKKAFSHIFDLNLKVTELLSLKDEVKELTNRVDILTIKQEEMNNTLNYHSLKLIDIEAHTSSMQEKIDKLESENVKTQSRLNNVEDNIAYLVKISEENARNLEKTNNNVNILRSVTDNHGIEIEKINEKIRNELDKMRSLELSFNEFKDFSMAKFTKIKEKRKLIKAKQTDMELNISKLFDFYSEIAVDIKRKDPSMMRNEDRRDNLSSYRSKDGNINIDFSTFYEEFNQYKLKLENLIREIKGRKSKSNGNEDPFGDDDLTFKGDEDIVHNFKKLTKDNITNDLVIDMINSFQDSLKKLSFHMSLKINKDDVDKYIKYSLVDFEKRHSKTSDAILKLESKIKNLASNPPDFNLGDKQEMIKMIEKLTNDYISSDLSQIINDCIMGNMSIKGLFTKSEKNSDELNRISKFIEEIKASDIFELDLDGERKMKNDLDQAQKSKTDENIMEIRLKLSDLENTLIDLKKSFDNNIQGTADEEDDEKNKEVSSNNLRDYIKNVYQSVRNVMDRVDKVTFKQESMNSEILGKVKKDLTSESNRILEEFRGDLKISIGKIEDQLREKVDRFNLDEFGKRMDNKFNNEISKKIDKFDLKKNNIMFNKKFDNLENKISKTLVDTLIDLQMEEAPLIIKKGAQADKCGSCNQMIPINPNMTQPSFSPMKFGMINSVSEDNSRFKLRAIQDISNKFGTGSYSRILNNINTETLNEDLKANLKSVTNSVHLPNIKYKSSVNSPRRKNMSLVKIEEVNEKNNVMEEEKKISAESNRKDKKK